MNDNIKNSYSLNHSNATNHTSLSTSIIITPYEKALTILNNVKQYINKTSKHQSKLLRGLDWVIKVITSHSLYAYELKEKDLINKLTKENADFKNFVDFVSKYNEQVIEMNKKNVMLGAKTIDMANDILQKPSINLKKSLKFSTPSKTIKLSKLRKSCKLNTKNDSNHKDNFIYNSYNTLGKSTKSTEINYDSGIKKNKTIKFSTITDSQAKSIKKFSQSNKNLRFGLKNKLSKTDNYVKKKSECIKGTKPFYLDKNILLSPKDLRKNPTLPSLLNKDSRNDEKNDSSLHHKTISEIDSISIINHCKKFKKNDMLNKLRSSLPINSSYNNLSYMGLQAMLNEPIFNTKLIMEKEFNLFDLEKKVGHQNVLPIMGRTMLDSFGLIDEKIMPIEKLDPFLYSVANQYLKTTLYHNSLHGADITQTICLFFNNSNAEEVCHTQAIDLLSIIIAGLGHDIGHPGLTNTFQINSSSEMAITYNDSSCLENFHLAKLFKTIRKDETNIFEKLSLQDYKKIRKRMISEILATDMAIHGKVLNNIRSKIPDYLLQEKNENNVDKLKKFELITDLKNEETTSEEKQALLDYFIHSADLGHNTKKFKISLRWVELLSREFWLQGDREKKMNLSVSFLCDRDSTNVPKSQVGFIGGFIIPTYNYLVVMFPTLSYTVENAKDNLNRWQKLADEGRKKGWSPAKIKIDLTNGGKTKDKKKKDGILKNKTNVVEIKID
jgi:hypothetical protein